MLSEELTICFLFCALDFLAGLFVFVGLITSRELEYRWRSFVAVHLRRGRTCTATVALKTYYCFTHWIVAMTYTPPTSLPDFAVLVEQLNTMQRQLQTKMAQGTAPAGTQLRFGEEAEFGQPSGLAAGTSGLRFSGGGREGGWY
jgi:hypothetical protein